MEAFLNRPRYTVLYGTSAQAHWQHQPGCHGKAPKVMIMRLDIKTTTGPDAKKCGIVQLLQHSTLVEQLFAHVTPNRDSIGDAYHQRNRTMSLPAFLGSNEYVNPRLTSKEVSMQDSAM